MAENVGTIYYTVEAETDKLLSGGRDAGAALDNLNKKAAQTDMRMKKTSAAIQGLGKSANGAATALRGLLPVLSAAYLVKLAQDIIHTADAWTELQNRLRLVTKSQDELKKSTDAVFRIAQTTSSEISSVAQVYQRFAQNADALGISLDEATKLTETVSKAVAISGASASAAEASLTQFGQALASGTLRGDEFNSILEQTPGLAAAIAEGLGVTVGELRQLGADGKITTDALIEGLTNVADSVDTKFQTRVKTAGQAWTELQNSVMRYIGEANEASGITTSLADAISSISEAIDNANIDDLVREIDAIKETINLVIEGVQALVDEFQQQFPEISQFIEKTVGKTDRSVRGMLLSTAKEVDGIVATFQGAAGAVSAIWEALAYNIPTFFANAWIEVKKSAASFVNDLADMINKPLNAIGLDGIEHVTFGTNDAIQAMMSLSEAAVDGWNEAAKGIGAYDEVLRRLTEREKARAEASKKANEAASGGGGGGRSGGGGTAKLTEEQKKAAKAADQNRQAIERLTQALSLSALKGEELAVAQAKLTLNPYATPEQIAQVEQLAAALYKADQLSRLQQKVGDDPATYIKGNVQPLSGGAFDDQAARYDAEAEAEQERYEAQLVRLREAMEAQLLTQEEYYAQFESLAQQHASRMDQIDNARAQVMLSSASDAFGSLAAVMKNAAGEQSGIYKALFAASKAFAIAESIIKIQQGIATAAALPFPANIPAMASVAAATAGIVSTIASTNIGSGRQYGGPVSAGAMHRINENGRPEVLNMANGQQFLLPNSRGEVVSNKDATSEGQQSGITVVVNNAPPGTTVNQGTDEDGQRVIEIVVGDLQQGGPISQQMETNYGMNRVGR